MRFSFPSLVCFAVASQALNILITNDDGAFTSNIRELYKAVKAYGHDAWIVASATDMSGQGGRAVFSTEKNLTTDSEFGFIKAGAPAFGQDPIDPNIFYYNGTPATMVFLALDYVLPKYANLSTVDLVLSGPNFGLNLGPFLYTISGTIGATYAAVERGIPAIAYSATYSSTAGGLQDPAVITGRLAANLAQSFITKAAGKRILPLGYGVNVNIPYITSFSNNTCVNPPYILTRMTSGAIVDKAVYNATTGLFRYGDLVADGVNQCINGDCSLPGETLVVNSGCQSAVSFFTVDYDAPSPKQCGNTTDILTLVPPAVNFWNSTNKVGGLGANSTVTAPSNGTNTTHSAVSTASARSSSTGVSSAVPTSGGQTMKTPVVAAVFLDSLYMLL
ncbi:unnamed protein product [Clonostachys chloroleuca]|uniref:Survival protein SurE-like phosphatase/nucleotidase domain-containing protein n=1 Tax=Clonostachys chloroleuca TaxID=1926264 RepID=A0AA35LPK7_9HYPO|nr:unnamed protein product [Clonostachys chloroleuca]